MATNRTVTEAPPKAVFAVLCDPRSFQAFVVGTKRIRRFDPTWPEEGSAFHHTLGVGPFVLRDMTRVVEVDDGRRLVLRAQMRPLAVNRVAFSLRPAGPGTQVEVEEYPIEGPAAKVWNRRLDRLMWLRNKELLRRLEKLASRRWAQQSAAGRP